MCNPNTTSDLTVTDANSSCACCAPANAEQQAPAAVPAGAVSEEFLVSGMTCGHCVSSVTEEISALEGVESVSVDLNAGGTSRVMVASAAPLSEEQVRAAVSEAGYDLVAPAR